MPERERLAALHGLLESVVHIARGLLPNVDLVPKERWGRAMIQDEMALDDAITKADAVLAARQGAEAVLQEELGEQDAEIIVLRSHLATATARVRELEAALEQSVMFQSHYAVLLNGWDGGQRMRFPSAQAWLDRLAAVAPAVGKAAP